MKTRSLSQAALTLAFLFTTGCPSNKSDSAPPPEVTTWFTQGDPNEFLAGATFDPASPITEEHAAEWNDYLMTRQLYVSERGQMVKTTKDIVARNASKDVSTMMTGKDATVSIKLNESGQWIMSLMGDNVQFELE